MTALKEYQRLESPGLWREHGEAQRRDVVVSFGSATLVVSDIRSGIALAHWSLPAVRRLNPGAAPALYAPDADTDETLEIDDDTMTDAIERVRGALSARRRRPGRLRLFATVGALAGAAVLLGLWLPGAAVQQAASIMPDATRARIGRDLLNELTNGGFRLCDAAPGQQALDRLAERLLVSGNGGIFVVDVGPESSLAAGARALPGGLVVLDHAVIADPDQPEVAAGHVIAAAARAEANDPLAALLETGGIGAVLQLLTTGDVSRETLHAYATRLTAQTPAPPPATVLSEHFAARHVAWHAYARSVEPSGALARRLEKTTAAPAQGQDFRPVMNDGDWVALQGICER